MGYMIGKMDTFWKSITIEEILEKGNAKDLFNKAYYLISTPTHSIASVKKDIEQIRDEIIKTKDMEVIYYFTLQLGFASNTINETLKNICLENCTERQLSYLDF